MSVVFDEVVTQVESPPDQRLQDPGESQDGEQQSSHEDFRNWQYHQATYRRRQFRKEAD